ncbi:MAG: DUF2807 domain-containing protein [Marinilabiliaceae bacterium]|nr:DUF2807 domain-containing protein [Marinilabiliaceae bacterium]
MNKQIILSLLLIISTTIIAQQNNQETQNTEIIIKKEKRELGSFTKIKSSKGINVTLIAGNKEYIEVHIKNGEPSDIISELKGKTLYLKMRTKLYNDMAVQVYVTYKQIIELEAGSGSTIDCDGAVICDRISLITGVDASMDIEIYAKSIEANISASRININGECDYQEIKVTTGGVYNASELISKEALIKANTGASANVNVKNKLTAFASTGGVIEYVGNPNKIEKTENVGGKVRPVN